MIHNDDEYLILRIEGLTIEKYDDIREAILKIMGKDTIVEELDFNAWQTWRPK